MTADNITLRLQSMQAELIAYRVALRILVIDASEDAKKALLRSVEHLPDVLEAQPLTDAQIAQVREHLQFLTSRLPLKS